MSQIEVKASNPDSEGTGLTFVRPLPAARGAGERDLRSIPTTPRAQLEFASRLFPPRVQEDSGSLPTVAGLELGHFVLEERIGRGGMGAVFRAIDQRLNRVVALKILSPDLSSDSEAVLRFQNEARAAARLDHDNVARVHYIGEENGLHFIAFEFVTGTNVREFILQKGRLTPASAVNYTLQIAEALRHTSAANVVHRDIKPSNIIISPTGRAKLVDLGLARHQPADQSHDLTVAGTALGTFDYIAPEQAIDARNVDVRSDIYSLGCTIFHMLTGEPPYPNGTMFQKVMNHHGATPPEVRSRNPHVSIQLSRVVQKMMASNPDERYASADALIHDLVQIAEALNLVPTYPEAVVWTAPLFKPRNPYWDGSRTWMAVALALLLVVYLVDRLQPGPGEHLAQDDRKTTPEIPIDLGRPENAATSAETVQNHLAGPVASDQSTVVNFIGNTAPSTATNTAQKTVESAQVEVVAGTLSGRPESVIGYSPAGFAEISWPTESTSEQTAKFWKTIGNFEGGLPREDVVKVSPRMNSVPEAATVTESGTAPAKSLPYLVTQSKSGVVEEVGTLAEAFGLAVDNSAIEIQADGVLPVQTSSIQFSAKRIVLRAAENFHPVIRFDLSEELTFRPLASKATVFDVGHGGALEIYDVDIELVVDPKTTVDEWAIVKLAPGAEFGTRWSSFTMHNPNRIAASLILIPASEPADISNLMPERMSGRPSAIQIRDSICRGQMDAIKQLNLHPLDIFLEQSAISISGVIHRIDGSNSVETNMTSAPEPTTTLILDHVSAILGEGLLEATTGDHGTLEPILVDIRNSVMKLEAGTPALIEISGHLDADLLKDKIEWKSQSDLSFVQSQGPLFTIESTASFSFEPEIVSTRDSAMTLVQGADLELFESSLPAARKWDEIVPGAFALQTSNVLKVNPALKSASDGRNAGVDWTRLGLSKVLQFSSQVENSQRSNKNEF